jgi:hypothetical protein
MVAPRWILVLGVSAGGILAAMNLRSHVEAMDRTTVEVSSLRNRMNRAEHQMVQNSIQVAQVRVDSLRWQIHSSARMIPGDTAFRDDVRDRLRDAERQLARLQREEQELLEMDGQ